MALQEEGADGGQSAPARGRRSGRRRLWSVVLCCGGCRGEEAEAEAAATPRGRLRPRKRTVPVVGGVGDEEVSAAPRTAGREMRRGEEAGEGSRRRRGCCFLLPLSCVPGLKRRIKGSNSNVHRRQRQQQREPLAPPPRSPRSQNVKTPPAEPPPRDAAPATTRGATAETGAPAASLRDATTPRAGADARRSGDVEAVARSCSRGEFGPAVGVSMVASASAAGLLGGRLWAVVCVCAWFAVLYALHLKRRPKAPATDGGGGAGERVSSFADGKKKRNGSSLTAAASTDKAMAAPARPETTTTVVRQPSSCCPRPADEPRAGAGAVRRTPSRRHGTPRPDGGGCAGGSLWTMATTLGVIVFFGRVTAVAFLCSCLYGALFVRAQAAGAAKGKTGDGAGGSSSSSSGRFGELVVAEERVAVVDLCTEEHKKKVVMEGLLDRAGKRLSSQFL